MPLAPKPTSADVERAMGRLCVQPDGEPFPSMSSVVLPVRWQGRAAVLKVTDEPEELMGTRALEAWPGQGAVAVLAQAGNAVLLERAGGSLLSSGLDDGSATRVLCDVVSVLHAHTPTDLNGFPTLRERFSSLFKWADSRFDPVRDIALELLEAESRPVLLHGDIHHGNVLDGGTRGWLAIDPKGIAGPREFDYCNIFTNPSLTEAVDNLDARLRTVSRDAHIEERHLLRWVAAWSALSGIWFLEDGDQDKAGLPHRIMDMALQRLSL